MNFIYRYFFLLTTAISFLFLSAKAQTGKLTGTIFNDYGYAVSEATIEIQGVDADAYADSMGNFELEVPANKALKLTITALGYEPEYKTVTVKDDRPFHINIAMRSLANVLDEHVFTRKSRGEVGKIEFDMENYGLRPDPSGGVEGMLKILVGSKNELSSQYAVRGGNYDENLVYINDFEIYRPFLVSNGQQEGLSVINPDMTQRVAFSVGGFQARHGDKMSSSLDITYKQPKKFAGSFMASLLGAQGHIENVSKDGKLYYMIGIRNKTNQYLLQSQPTKGQYNPSFLDGQVVVGYRFNPKWETEFIGNYSRNRFSFIPETRTEFFGLLNEAYSLTSQYEGSELDQFDAMFGGWSLTYKPNKKTQLKLMVSGFQTNEFETYDLSQTYLLSAIETDLGKSVGDVLYSLGSGTIINHARNYLQASVLNIGHIGSYNAGKHFIEWGASVQAVQVWDKLKEWEYRDSAGYSQPHNPTAATMYYSYNAENELSYQRITAFIQDNIVLNEDNNMVLNIGVRANYSLLNKEMLLSPRIQYSFKPNWGDENNIVLRLASGLYSQPPFYREMRDFDGPLNTELKAQKSWHIAGGFDWNFVAWNQRLFKFTGEVFYKSLWDLTPYEYDNVRIRYYPNNTAVGYTYGGEVRLFGELAKDAESWVSMGFLKTENKFLKPDGTYSEYIPRPTDQRFTFGMYFSDYLPRNKNFKVFLNMMYSTGLPYNMPGKAFEPGYQIRIPDYKRVDIGFAALLLDGKRNSRPAYSLFSYFDDVWLSLEVFNLLGNRNTLSYDWIQPLDSEALFLVPNRLTNRLINVKLAFRF